MENLITMNLNKLLKNIALLMCFTCSASSVLADDSALILRGDTEAFVQVVEGLTGDLEGDLLFQSKVVDEKTNAADIRSSISETKPSVIVLIGNHAINAYTKYQQASGDGPFPPAVAIAALYVDQLVSKLENTTGIRYEIPAVTSIVNLRALLSSEVKKVGVIYRSWMKDFIEENREYCRREGIELIGYEIEGSSKKYGKKIKKGLKKLIKKDVDAFWVVNDNALLDKNGITKGWIPGLKKFKAPVIVGVKSLIQTKYKFGSYAIVPDHYALGVQGASVVADLMDEDWELDDREIEQPLSVQKIVNRKLFDKKKVSYSVEKLAEVDEVINK